MSNESDSISMAASTPNESSFPDLRVEMNEHARD
jgi:hypothetical protein